MQYSVYAESYFAQFCYRNRSFRQSEAVTFVAVGLMTHSRVIPRLSTGVAAASCVKDTSDNELHAVFRCFRLLECGQWPGGGGHKKCDRPGQQNRRGSKLGGEMNTLN